MVKLVAYKDEYPCQDCLITIVCNKKCEKITFSTVEAYWYAYNTQRCPYCGSEVKKGLSIIYCKLCLFSLSMKFSK